MIIALLLAANLCQVVYSERIFTMEPVKPDGYMRFFENEIWRSGKMDVRDALKVYLRLNKAQDSEGEEWQFSDGTKTYRMVNKHYWMDCGQWAKK